MANGENGNGSKMKETLNTLKPKSDWNGGLHIHLNLAKVVITFIAVLLGTLVSLASVNQTLKIQIRNKIENQINIEKLPIVFTDIDTLKYKVNFLQGEQKTLNNSVEKLTDKIEKNTKITYKIAGALKINTE